MLGGGRIRVHFAHQPQLFAAHLFDLVSIGDLRESKLIRGKHCNRDEMGERERERERKERERSETEKKRKSAKEG